jgi:hypothetical protein
MQESPVPQRFLAAAMGKEIAQAIPRGQKVPAPPRRHSMFAQNLKIQRPICVEKPAVTETAALVINLDLKLAYDPAEGRLYRTDAEGAIIYELKTWRWDKSRGHYASAIINLPGPRASPNYPRHPLHDD